MTGVKFSPPRALRARQFLGGPLAVVPRVSRTGVSARTSAGVYTRDEPARDHLGLALLPDPPPLLRPPPLLTDAELE